MNTEESDKYGGQRLGLFIFDCFMSVMYLVLSIILLFTSFLENWQIQREIKIGLGVLFGLYGIFRVTRATKMILRKNR
ncbi:MAG: hypothetical protein LBG45_10295 [Dysgonamonadaceae bacterium]|jgi:hypothetical protein|nr:hypothetical protein [Dysgonamonadaceae bacterium]